MKNCKQEPVEDTLWLKLYKAAEEEAKREPILASYLYAIVLNHKTLEEALAFHLAGKLASSSLQPMLMREVIDQAFCESNKIGEEFRADLKAIHERDPAAYNFAEPFLHYKGFHALQSYRVAHWLWKSGRKGLASHLQNRISELFGVDIHPAAQIGKGILIDHATSVVIGETAVIEDDVSILHEVTLGGTGNIVGDRHPKVRKGVLIGAGAKILGNVEIGEYSKIAAGSVVLTNIPPHSTAAGVPAKIIGKPFAEIPAHAMNQMLNKPRKR
ncbi:serine O-acetyltransferase [bacterium]|nr:serine O-acetyltransferase [bacterium]